MHSNRVFYKTALKIVEKNRIHIKIVEKNLIHVRFQGDPHPSVSRLSSNKMLISLRNLASTIATIKHSEIMLQGGLVRIACNCVEINSAAGDFFRFGVFFVPSVLVIAVNRRLWRLVSAPVFVPYSRKSSLFT